MEVVKTVVFKHNVDVKPLLQLFNQMVNRCMNHALEHGISSPMKLEKALYDEFKQCGLATHYCISACRMACSAIKSWKRLVRRGRADRNSPPTFKALAMRLQKELMRFKGDKIAITTRPHHRVEVPLIGGSYQKQFIEAWKRGEMEIGEVTLFEDRAIVTFKKDVEEREPEGYVSIDVNLMSLDLLETKDMEYRRIDLKKLYGIRVHYFERRRRIQRLSKFKPKTSKRLERKYSGREKRRVNDLLHKITAELTRELLSKRLSPILESLKGLAYNRTRSRYRRKNRKVASLPYRKIQSSIEYKMAWQGYKTHYIKPKNTSKTCPRCGSLSKVKGQIYECKRCGYKADRHFVACVNILKMWGSGFTPKALDELIEREGLSRDESQCIST